MTHTSVHCGNFLLDVWGGGTSVALTHQPDGLSVHWQGDEASDILNELEGLDYKPSAFTSLWDIYSGVAS